MRAEPKVIQINEGELRAKLRQIEEAMGTEFAEPFRQLLDGHVTILELLRENNISIKRLQKLIFGSSSEKSSKIMPEEDNSPEPATDIGASDVPSAAPNNPQSKPRPGHGRIPAQRLHRLRTGARYTQVLASGRQLSALRTRNRLSPERVVSACVPGRPSPRGRNRLSPGAVALPSVRRSAHSGVARGSSPEVRSHRGQHHRDFALRRRLALESH